jgi:hypothetical protein
VDYSIPDHLDYLGVEKENEDDMMIKIRRRRMMMMMMMMMMMILQVDYSIPDHLDYLGVDLVRMEVGRRQWPQPDHISREEVREMRPRSGLWRQR